MNDFYVQLCYTLKVFDAAKKSFEELVTEDAKEILNCHRVSKKEVLDMSDLLDKMSILMLKQNAQIKDQSEQLNKIKKLVPGGDEIEDIKPTQYDENTPLGD